MYYPELIMRLTRENDPMIPNKANADTKTGLLIIYCRFNVVNDLFASTGWSG